MTDYETIRRVKQADRISDSLLLLCGLYVAVVFGPFLYRWVTK